jgi:serine/threonine protein kinase
MTDSGDTPGHEPTSTFSGAPPALDPAAAAASPLGGSRLGLRYRLIEELGRGGMGIVFKAVDEQRQRLVALKVIRPDRLAQASAIERFRRESAILRRIHHPNVCPVLDAGEAGDTLYISMEYLEGPTLRSLLERSGPLPTEEVLRFGVQLASALAAIHREGIVHRDVKPHNIIISDDRAFLMDFGIAYHPAFRDLTATGPMPGSLNYLSPEQAKGQPVGPRSDLYALGLVLFEMCTASRAPGDVGEIPLALRGPGARCRRPSELAPNVPPELDAIVLKCLGYSPRRRFASASAVESSLARARARACLDEDRPPGPRPHARTIAGVAAAVGALVCGALLTSPEHRTLPAPLRQADASMRGGVELSPSAEKALCRVSSRLETSLSGYLAEGVGRVPQAWTAAQALFALDAARLDRQRWSGFLAGQRFEQERLWRKYPEAAYPTHLAASAWVFLALAHLGAPAERADIWVFLAEQQDQGAWPIYAGAREGDSASTYATATALLALEAQRSVGHEESLAHSLQGASKRAIAYLLAARESGQARWSDYPDGPPQLGVSGLALHALHQGLRQPLAEIDRLWLHGLPDEPAGPGDFESSGRTVHASDGRPIQSDDTRHYELPWCVVATLDAYPSGTHWQRTKALRWIERVLARPDPAAGIAGDDDDAWIAAELLLAFRRLGAAAQARCPSS